VNYINALAKFVDRNTIEYTTKDEGVKRITAANIVISVGGRPLVPSNIPGALEYGITSDDIFYLKKPPGKTLCVGGSYIALENAGFLTELGYDVTVAARSILLRGFDRQCVAKIETTMKDLGTTIMSGFQPTSIVKLSSGKLQVTFMDTLGEGVQKIEVYDTVLFATGRTPDLKGLDLPAAGVTIAESGKLPVHNERTNISNIFAVGDVCDGKQELTPVAVRAGELLAKRLFGNSDVQMDYDNVATTVFTPFEYGNVGLSEEDAIQKYGEEDLEVYMYEFTTLELSAVHRFKHAKHGDELDMGPSCMSKLVCVKSEGERVVGFHFIGPNAGEVTQVRISYNY
jgi:thioredoxin reductase (NADPH)